MAAADNGSVERASPARGGTSSIKLQVLPQRSTYSDSLLPTMTTPPASSSRDYSSTHESSDDSTNVSSHTSSLSRSQLQPQSEAELAATESNSKTEKEQFLESLENYIPVGILKRHNGVDEETAGSGFPAAELASLEGHHWIRTTTHVYDDHPEWSYVRVYVLPDDTGRRFVPRSSTALRRALRVVMSNVDSSPDAWEGKFAVTDERTAQGASSDSAEDESLWYIFNTLEGPNPKVEDMRDPYSRRAMEGILFGETGENGAGSDESMGVIGLKTPLYPYQRRSAAAMIRREVQPSQMLDPRLQAYRGPTGQEYYYDRLEGSLVREKRLYSEACGGILAETMGCGKTLICLAVILATRGHFPKIPTRYQQTTNPVRERTGSLVEMAAAAAGRFSIPWKSRFDLLRDSGIFHERCVAACEKNRGAYTIPPSSSRYGSRGKTTYPRPPPTHLRLCSGTLVIVPANLVAHWKHEIASHTEGLNVLVLQTSSDVTPCADELLQYDIVLYSRTRFEKEAGGVVHNRRAPPELEYDSPLKQLHWLRIIVDEGHNVAGHGHKTNMVHILDQLHVERRWVVSGTPSTGLYGVEVSLASQETQTSDTEPADDATWSVLQSRKKTGIAADEELKDLDKLRLIVVEFLNLKPWSNSRAEDSASWTKYIKPVGEDGKRRKAPSLRATLQSLVVRHPLDVINNEIPLPRLSNRVVYIEPTFYDRLSINLFLFQLTVNTITSERSDQDYMFHPRNRKHLSLLINNLRQAGFWWAGSKRKDIEASLDNALKYLEQNSRRMSKEDIGTLCEGIRIARKALDCTSWNAFNQFHELGVFVQDFPSHARGMWALDSSGPEHEPLLLGISQARMAQKFVTSRLTADDPAEGLAGAGIRARREMSEWAGKSHNSTNASEPATAGMKKNAADRLVHKPPSEQNSPKKTFSRGLTKSLPPASPLAQTKLVATASAKLTYLLDKVLELHKTEKIIIFYEHNNTAFWIAEGLEMLGIEFRIYASTLKTRQRADYLSLFDQSEEVRVLVMDLRQASHGLHVASASRVFIVNPIWRPNVESQAIKRAHRIGQTKPVFVETLVLKDTLEDKMLKRRKEMSNAELTNAEKDLLDDSTMSSIIQNERFIPMPDDGDAVSARPAYLKDPPGFFDRHKLPIPDNHVDPPVSPSGVLARQPDPITLTTPSKRRRRGSAAAPPLSSPDIPWVESDVSMGNDFDWPTPTKRRRKSPSSVDSTMMTPNGIVMTPGRRPGPRTPLSAIPAGPDGAADEVDGVGEAPRSAPVPSLFGDGTPSASMAQQLQSSLGDLNSAARALVQMGRSDSEMR
ncbi:hypothetical protein VTN02DRAFT_3012 [Thermoascus thermophilus]